MNDLSGKNKSVGNTDADRGQAVCRRLFLALPEVELTGVLQMLLPDVDQSVTSALNFNFLLLPAHVRAHTHERTRLLWRVGLCIAR